MIHIILNLLCFCIILGITVLIHEMGHFLFAKKAGVYVYEFSIGMGPKLFHFKRKNDETEYSIRLLPIGGFVSMAGEVEEEDNTIPKEKQMANKTWGQRFMTIIAGILFNFLLAIVIFFFIGLSNGAISRQTYIAVLEENYPAIETNLQVGDEILAINGKEIYSSDMLLLEMQVYQGKAIDLTVKHEDSKKEVIHIEPKEETNAEGTTYRYGFQLSNKIKKGFLPAIQYAFEKTISLLLQMFHVIWYLIIGKLSVRSLSGPVGIYNLVGETAKAGFLNLVYLTGYLSLNIGFVNFLPIPAMDGGRAFFLLIEKIKGSPVNPKVENLVHTIGLCLLMILLLYVTFNDIIRFF